MQHQTANQKYSILRQSDTYICTQYSINLHLNLTSTPLPMFIIAIKISRTCRKFVSTLICLKYYLFELLLIIGGRR